MFVLLFGLMGVAAIFPVGNHYVIEGEKFDRGIALANNAFEEIRARGMLAPDRWVYAGDTVQALTENGEPWVIQPATPMSPRPSFFNLDPNNVGLGAGHAFVIDPVSTGDAYSIGDTDQLDIWPRYDEVGAINPNYNPWYPEISGQRWPVRRVTFATPNAPVMPLTVAKSVFSLRDDLKISLPDRDDYPGTVQWNAQDINNTPDNPTDDILLTRSSQENFSWLATVVPLTLEGRSALQPSERRTHPYEVSVVVFYKRVPTPLPETERLMRAEMLSGGELVMFGSTAAEVDAKFENFKAGNWVAVMGINETTRAFTMKWYRMLSLEDETYQDDLPSGTASGVFMRRAMLLGPDWHLPNNAGGAGNLRVAIFPGVASVVTREMELTRPVD